MQGSPSRCGWLEISEVSQVEKGEHRRSSDTNVSVAGFTDVVPLLKRIAPLFLRLFLVLNAMASYNDAHAHTCTHEPTHRSTVRSCHKGKSLKRGCCTVAA